MELRPQRILDYREYPVLCVDDEVENLRIFELSFKREFTVLSAASAEEALRILHQRPVAVVLSDHRMPGMTGVELLAHVREVEPRAIRMLVTAYGDAETLSRAVNDGSIYRYVPKPWEPDDLRLNLRQAIDVYALDREREDLLRELTTLNRVSNTINQQIELGPLLDLLLQMVTEELGFDGASLAFFDPDQERLSLHNTAPSEGPVAGWLRRFAIEAQSAPHFLQRLRQGESQLLSQEDLLDVEPPVREWLSEVAAQQMLVMPLQGRDRVIGALVADNRRGGRGFDVSDRTLLEGLATHAVIAIENARLVNDLRRSREQVIRADRLGTLGTLAAGLAHEINNPLTSVHTFLSLAPAKRAEEDPEFWGDYHALATRELERIRGLVASMERLAKGPSGDQAVCEVCSLEEIAKAAVALLGREAASAGVHLGIDADPRAPKVVAVRDYVHQVLLNLILNATHAAGEGGRVEIRVLADDRGERAGACIEVEDDGPGMQAEELERIFDPFFTTKGPDQGTGLGLTICQQLVSAQDGALEVQSRPGEGALFRVWLAREPREG